MKKLYTVVVVMIVMFALAGAAKACSNGQISPDKSIVRMATDPHAARASMLVVAKDINGEVLCEFSSFWTSTTRNMFYPEDYWPKNVDRIHVFRQGGVAIVTYNTPRPAGTTVYAEANGMKVGNTNGMPFCYMDCNIPNK